MCKEGFDSFLRALPKVEHHLHLEGTLEPDLLFQLAAINSTKLPHDDEAFRSEATLIARYKQFTSLDDFLHYYYIGMSVLITSSDFEKLAWHYFQRASLDGVKHAEVFFDPQAHISRGINYDTVLNGFTAAKERAEKELGISVYLIACFLRHLPVAQSLLLFDDPEIQKGFSDGRVIGIGLDSSESGFPPKLFKEIFEKAKELNIRRTAHAAEEGPPQNIISSLDDIYVERIDHGLKATHDDEVMARIVRDNILLTLCPVSNVLLRCVPTIKDVPIRKFLAAGVKFSLNSDDPAYFGAYILEVYIAVQEAFQLSVKEWETICKNGIEGSWCSDNRKVELLSELESVIGNWKNKEAL
jgi:adenosine deaminase